MRLRLLRTLSERPVGEKNISHFINRELLPLLRELLRSLTSPPVEFSWSSNTARLDVSRSNDFAAANTLTGNSTLTLLNGADGYAGAIVVQQDSVGGWTMTVVADGRITLREEPFLDDSPDSSADSVTRYRYLYVTVNGVAYLILERMSLV